MFLKNGPISVYTVLNQNHSGPNIPFFPEATVEIMLYFRFNLRFKCVSRA